MVVMMSTWSSTARPPAIRPQRPTAYVRGPRQARRGGSRHAGRCRTTATSAWPRFAIASGTDLPAPDATGADLTLGQSPDRLQRRFLTGLAHRGGLRERLARDLAERTPAGPDRHPCRAKDDERHKQHDPDRER